MNRLTEEIKTRARLLQKQLQRGHQPSIKRVRILCRQQRWNPETELSLSQCMNLVAADTGFRDWEHARRAFTASGSEMVDMGSFWYGEHSAGFTNLWFSDYAQAKQQHAQQRDRYLLPYRHQFVLVESAFLQEAGIEASADIWQSLDCDLVAHHGSPEWVMLAELRLQQTRLERWEKCWDAQGDQQALQSNADEAAATLSTFNADGRLLKIPQQRKKRLVILQWLVKQIANGRDYSEIELNQLIRPVHDDVATLRRELVVHGLMRREQGRYRRSA
jgi:hypothetical protein